MSEQQLGPPPVEALSDVAWARVERNVFSRMEGTVTAAAASRTTAPERPRTWLWLALPLAAAAAAALMIWTSREKPAPQAAAEPEAPRFVAGAAPSTVTFGDAHITLDAQSALTMAATGATLEYGAARFETGHAFTVHAGDLRAATATAALFHVARTAEHASVDIDLGMLVLRYHGATVTLQAHDRWMSDALIDPADLTAPTDGGVADRAQYEAAAQLEAIKPAAAMKGYLALSHGTGPWSEVALYAAARLAADFHDAHAEALVTTYLHRFPSGANATDARQLLTRLKGD